MIKIHIFENFLFSWKNRDAKWVCRKNRLNNLQSHPESNLLLVWMLKLNSMNASFITFFDDFLSHKNFISIKLVVIRLMGNWNGILQKITTKKQIKWKPLHTCLCNLASHEYQHYDEKHKFLGDLSSFGILISGHKYSFKGCKLMFIN